MKGFVTFLKTGQRNNGSTEAAISAKLLFIEGFGIKSLIVNHLKKKKSNPPKKKILLKTDFRSDFSDFSRFVAFLEASHLSLWAHVFRITQMKLLKTNCHLGRLMRLK